jgi:hypothetical protein
MRLIKIFSLLLILSVALGSCEALLDPLDDNHSTFERIYNDAPYAEGLLITAYTRIPTNGLTYNDVSTDDAVSNVKLNNYLRMATGQWSALNNPVSQWDNCNSAIMYLNLFLTVVDSVNWKWTNAEIRKLMTQRFTGEAYAMRGLFKYHLLQTVGGFSADGQLLGIPIYDTFIETPDEFNTPRSTFAQSIASINADFDKALTYLTVDDYKDVPNAAALPPGFTWVANYAYYNTVFGNVAMQRISGRIVKALKARVALLEASPAFNPSNDLAPWQNAATLAANVLNTIGGVATGIDPNGHRWYVSTYIDALALTTPPNNDQKEMIWRRPRGASNTRESANFPPSLYGQGNLNPTQNLVDAFPMLNGYPITDAVNSGYVPGTPYTGRDPRLTLYILTNGSTYKSTVIKTGIGGGVNAKDSIQTSTRTGYYLKKLLREDVSMNPTGTSTKNHYEVHMRYTELFLIYAEAANEAYGPDGNSPNATYSARQVIRALRARAGIPLPDNYLAGITTTEAMRDLIRNERRLELCFEGNRFWDLRRWKADLTEAAKGVNINKAGTTFDYVPVEERAYDNTYMHYGPLPQNEILKFNALIQNKGW